MASKIFINLPVNDLSKTVAFFTGLGFTFNPQFTDEKATCMIVSDSIFVMLLVEPFFKSFSKKEICDTSKSNEVILALSYDTREEVDALADKAEKAGAKTTAKDEGFMYTRTFEDINGHQWELFYMDPNAGQ